VEESADIAIETARLASSSADIHVASDAWPALEAGQRVSVTPVDYGAVPVHGELVSLTQNEVALRREHSRVGELVVHFPRQGYKVEKQ
jgi:hypothetical protein